ncbi:MAG: hypothetical protein RMM29_03030 [Planctomycetota bacterium]|nr:hypothetical protein [Planctomycetota bacterium]MCX8040021.1 hypothetical protein [Planctomycetota bacterium]MDW8372607.1 hypothetical protein [Planctomycetota bacterium]
MSRWAMIAALLLAACSGEPRLLEPRLQAVRTYGWPSTVVDPEPDWSPVDYRLLVRSQGGFALLSEGTRQEQRFAAQDGRESHHPRWLNRQQFVFGPGWWVRRDADGRVLTPSEGITLVTLEDGRPVQRRVLSERGWRPQPWQGLILVEEAQRLLEIDAAGGVREFGEGFNPVPQPNGPGLFWRDTPAFDPDWWTGRDGVGQGWVRWRPGKVDALGDAVQAAWTHRGGLLITVRRARAAPGQPWWAGGTDVYWVAGPGAQPALARAHARDPAAHPTADLMAWTGEDNGVWIGTLRPDGWRERIAEDGYRPRWSHDGRRLCWLQPPPPGSQLPTIRVTVLAEP